MQIVAQVGAFLAWFAIVVLGRQPKGLQDMIVLGLSYQQRAYTYIALITEDWPPFTDDSARQVEQPPSFGALPSTPPAATPDAPTHADPQEPYAPAETPAEQAPAPPEQPPAPPATPPAMPPTPDRDVDDEPPPGPFGPSSTNP
jgi:hypothetical protein